MGILFQKYDIKFVQNLFELNLILVLICLDFESKTYIIEYIS